MNNYRIEFGEYNDQLLQKVVDLFAVAFYWSKKYTMEYLKWQYFENPNGTVVSFNAFSEEGELAAHYATIPINMLIDGEKVKGLLSLNTATHPSHQGNRLFTRLANETYKRGMEMGYKFVIGVANANSTHGFLKHLKFDLISPLIFKIGIGDIYKGELADGLNKIFYDSETLQWRLKCPEFKYSVSGNTILSKRPEPLFHTCAAKLPKDFPCEILGLKRTFDVFNIYIGLGANTKNGLYFDLPGFIHRSPFNLIFRDLTEGELPKITKDNIFFQLLDYDVA